MRREEQARLLEAIKRKIIETIEADGDKKVFSFVYLQDEIPGVLEYAAAFEDKRILIAKTDMNELELGFLPAIQIHGNIYKDDLSPAEHIHGDKEE